MKAPVQRFTPQMQVTGQTARFDGMHDGGKMSVNERSFGREAETRYIQRQFLKRILRNVVEFVEVVRQRLRTRHQKMFGPAANPVKPRMREGMA